MSVLSIVSSSSGAADTAGCPRRATVLGAGSWGTALACALQRSGISTTLWARRPDLTHAIDTTGRNPRHLPDLELPEGLRATSDMARALRDTELVIAAVPSSALRGVARQAAAHMPSGVPALVACKGIERKSGALMTTVLREELESADPLVGTIAGPSFADEVVRGEPVMLTLGWSGDRLEGPGARAHRIGKALQQRLQDAGVALEISDDAVGLQVAGACKNIIAVACGMATACGLGENARAAIVTRGVADMRRLTVALGGRPDTLLSAAGIGDLFLTAGSSSSRNTRLGLRLGRGEAADDGSGDLAEGAVSAQSIQVLERRLGLRLEVAHAVRSVLLRRARPDEALQALLNGAVQPTPALRRHGVRQQVQRPVRDAATHGHVVSHGTKAAAPKRISSQRQPVHGWL